MKRMRHVARMEETRSAYKSLVRKPAEKKSLVDYT